MHAHHRSASQTDRVWHAVEMHDGKWVLTQRQGPEAMLVALGAGVDVDGIKPSELGAREVKEVLAASPRLQFKRHFTSLLIEHCQRKPSSQRATWLEGLCRNHAPQSSAPSVEQEIQAANLNE